MEDEGFYGIALDGDGELCRVRDSNAGHLLFAGLPRPSARARGDRSGCCRRAFDSGWGLRTLATGQAALQSDELSQRLGLAARHGALRRRHGPLRRARAAWSRCLARSVRGGGHFDMRLPELFCGFPRQPGEPPIAYPVACLPQAWAAGSVFMMLQALPGPAHRRRRGEVRIENPHLPDGVDRLTIHALDVGGGRIDLGFERIGQRVVAFRAGGARDVRVLAKV